MGQALCSPGATGAMWLWKVHFRIHKHTLPVSLNASLSIYCMYSTFQTDRQTGHIWGATNVSPSPFLLLSLLAAPVIPPREGKWWGWSGWPDWASCVTTDLWVCVCGREGGIQRPYYRPTTNWASQTATSQQLAAETLQDLYCDSMRMCACVLLSITNKYLVSNVFNTHLNVQLVHFYMEK